MESRWSLKSWNRGRCLCFSPHGPINFIYPKDPGSPNVFEDDWGHPNPLPKRQVFRFHETILKRWARIPRDRYVFSFLWGETRACLFENFDLCGVVWDELYVFFTSKKVPIVLARTGEQAFFFGNIPCTTKHLFTRRYGVIGQHVWSWRRKTHDM